MALIKSVRGFTPQIGKDTFLADNATIIGDVEIGEGCSIWFGTVLRRRCKLHPDRQRGEYTGWFRPAHLIRKIDD